MSTGGRPLPALGLLVVAVLGVVLGLASPALAHNQLIGSDPADEDRLAKGPAEVELTFLASLDPSGAELDVTGPDGASAVAGEPDFDGASVTIPVNAPLAGGYEISYDVLSTDGHWVDGTVTFTVTEGEPAADPTPTPSPSPPPAPTPAATPPATTEPEPAAASNPDDGGGLPGWGWLLAAVVLGAGAAATFLVTRRRRAS